MIVFNILLGIAAFILLCHAITAQDNQRQQTLSLTFVAVIAIIIIANHNPW